MNENYGEMMEGEVMGDTLNWLCLFLSIGLQALC